MFAMLFVLALEGGLTTYDHNATTGVLQWKMQRGEHLTQHLEAYCHRLSFTQETESAIAERKNTGSEMLPNTSRLHTLLQSFVDTNNGIASVRKWPKGLARALRQKNSVTAGSRCGS